MVQGKLLVVPGLYCIFVSMHDTRFILVKDNDRKFAFDDRSLRFCPKYSGQGTERGYS